MKKLTRFFSSEFFIHLIKYGCVGSINTVFTFAIYYFLLKFMDVHYLMAVSVAWFVGVMATYVVNFKWVFKPEEKLVFRSRLAKYLVVYMTSYSLNMLLLGAIKESTQMDPIHIQVFVLPIVIVINFLGIKFWSLKRYEDIPGEPGDEMQEFEAVEG